MDPWEVATGVLPSRLEMEKTYAHPEDRDFVRDYEEGTPASAPTVRRALVYLPEVLRYYLTQRRPASLTTPRPWTAR